MLEQTSNSSNISWWRDGGLFAEVLTAGSHKVRGKWVAYRPPCQSVTVYRNGIGEIGSFTFRARELTARGLTVRVNRWLKEQAA
jgi:hypothetical protein